MALTAVLVSVDGLKEILRHYLTCKQADILFEEISERSRFERDWTMKNAEELSRMYPAEHAIIKPKTDETEEDDHSTGG